MQAGRIPLIVDADLQFAQNIRMDPKARQIPPLFASNEEESHEVISGNSLRLMGIFINPKVGNPFGIPVIRKVLQSCPSLPIVYLVDGPIPISKDELSCLAVRRVVRKPITYSDMIGVLQDVVAGFHPDKALSKAKDNSDKLGEEALNDDAAFVPIAAKGFLSGSSSFFDLYVRLGGGRYLKILQAGDCFTPERLTNYISKGVEYFYLRKEAQEVYLQYCDHLTSKIIANPRISEGAKISMTLNQGAETVSFLRTQGMNESGIHHAEQFVDNVKSLARHLDRKKAGVLDKYLSDISNAEHGVATSMIATLLTGPLRFEADKSVNVVGLASMFHDIGFTKIEGEGGSKLAEEDEENMSDQERKLYETHPVLGGSILREIRGVDVVVPQAVEQHHERRNRSGFPRRIGSGLINRVAEVVAISDEFAKLIRRAKSDPTIDPLKEIELGIKDRFSSAVMEAFRIIFKR